MNWNELESETIYNISAKLIRRLRKFELLKQSNCLCPRWIESTKDYLTNAHAVIVHHWNALNHDTEININTAALKTIQPNNDLNMKLSALDAFLYETRA